MKKIEEFDVVIIGGGPAGMSALLWSSELGLHAVLLEKEVEFGGQLLHTYNQITNYPGVFVSNGRELRDKLMCAMRDHGRCCRGNEIVTAELAERSVTDANRITYKGRALIIATGVRRRALEIPGEREFEGRGVLNSGVGDRAKVVGKRVVIVGGGDAALENAVQLAEVAERVFVVHRRDTFRARSTFLQRAFDNEKIEILSNKHMVEISGSEAVESVGVEDVDTGRRSILAVDAVLIRIGVVPNSEIFGGQIELDQGGYIVVDSKCETSRQGVFAIGDVVNVDAPTIAAAAGQASIAAKFVSKELAN